MSLSLERWLFAAALALVVLLIPHVIEKPARVGTFTRQAECRKTAEALIEHLRDDVQLHLHPSLQAHFSPKYGHCYAQVFNMDIGATELFDALENQALATWVGDSGDEHVGSYVAWTPESELTKLLLRGSSVLTQEFRGPQMGAIQLAQTEISSRA